MEKETVQKKIKIAVDLSFLKCELNFGSVKDRQLQQIFKQAANGQKGSNLKARSTALE